MAAHQGASEERWLPHNGQKGPDPATPCHSNDADNNHDTIVAMVREREREKERERKRERWEEISEILILAFIKRGPLVQVVNSRPILKSDFSSSNVQSSVVSVH
jgi:hypothetical protein